MNNPDLARERGKPIIPWQRLTLDNHMQLPSFSGDSVGIGTMFEKPTQKEGKAQRLLMRVRGKIPIPSIQKRRSRGA